MPASSTALPSASRRESATASTFTPPSARSSAAGSPSSLDVSTTACSHGISRNWLTSRRAPLASITPGRSLLPNTSGCSIEPVAITSSAGRKRCIVRPW